MVIDGKYYTDKQKQVPINLCTIDHLESKWHPRRGKDPQIRRDKKLVAACTRCNGLRDKRMLMDIPLVIRHQAASGGRVAELRRTYEAELLPIVEKHNARSR